MTLQKLNDLDIGVISDQLGSQLRDQLGNQFSAQTDNLKSMLRDAAQTAQTKNPFPLSEQEKKTTGRHAGCLRGCFGAAVRGVPLLPRHRQIRREGSSQGA
jgi:hypothetical protein